MPRPLSYFQTRQRPAPDWIIPHWLKRKNTGIIMGRPKRACKSWLLLNLAWQLSEGKPLWGITHSKDGPLFIPTRPLRIIYFTQEDAEDDIHDRISLMLAAGCKPNDNFLICPKDLRFTLDEPTHIGKELDEATKGGPLDLILFDPLRRMFRGRENDSDVIAGLFRTLGSIEERYNCSCIISHHIVKPPRESSSLWDESSPFAGRGSGDIYGSGDAFINVVENPGRGRPRAHRRLDLYFETKRSGELSPVTLALNFTTGLTEFVGFAEGRPKEEENES